MLEAITLIREGAKKKAIEKIKMYLSSLGLKRYKAILFGSFARGDFNEFSDIDLLIISDELPKEFNKRLSFLNLNRWNTPEVEPIGWTFDEYKLREYKHDPFIELLKKEGVVIEELL